MRISFYCITKMIVRGKCAQLHVIMQNISVVFHLLTPVTLSKIQFIISFLYAICSNMFLASRDTRVCKDQQCCY